jgi:hypothetical protein
MENDMHVAGLRQDHIVALSPVLGPRRTPLVLAYVRLGPVVAVYAVAGMKRRQLQLRMPRAANGEAGIELPDWLAGEVERAIFAAIRADHELCRHLFQEARLTRKGVT